MASFKHLDEEGLSKVWGKAKAAFSDKVETQNALNKKFELPSGGTVGQVLTKTEDGTAWNDASSGSSESNEYNEYAYYIQETAVSGAHTRYVNMSQASFNGVNLEYQAGGHAYVSFTSNGLYRFTSKFYTWPNNNSAAYSQAIDTMDPRLKYELPRFARDSGELETCRGTLCDSDVYFTVLNYATEKVHTFIDSDYYQDHSWGAAISVEKVADLDSPLTTNLIYGVSEGNRGKRGGMIFSNNGVTVNRNGSNLTVSFPSTGTYLYVPVNMKTILNSTASSSMPNNMTFYMAFPGKTLDQTSNTTFQYANPTKFVVNSISDTMKFYFSMNNSNNYGSYAFAIYKID